MNSPHLIDIHTHFLPGVDDGPRDIEETIQMLRVAHSAGTRGLVATPHMFFDLFGNYDVAEINDEFARTIVQLRALSDMPGNEFLKELELYLGAENYASPEFLEALERGDYITLNGSRHLLVEFPPILPKAQILATLENVLMQGLTPVVAHVERYAAVQRAPGFVGRLLEMGCLTQINAESLSGSFWSPLRRTSQALLDRDMITVIASDGHGAMRRPPVLKGAYSKLRQKQPEEWVNHLFVDNPRWLVGRAEQ